MGDWEDLATKWHPRAKGVALTLKAWDEPLCITQDSAEPYAPHNLLDALSDLVSATGDPADPDLSADSNELKKTSANFRDYVKAYFAVRDNATTRLADIGDPKGFIDTLMQALDFAAQVPGTLDDAESRLDRVIRLATQRSNDCHRMREKIPEEGETQTQRLQRHADCDAAEAAYRAIAETATDAFNALRNLGQYISISETAAPWAERLKADVNSSLAYSASSGNRLSTGSTSSASPPSDDENPRPSSSGQAVRLTLKSIETGHAELGKIGSRQETIVEALKKREERFPADPGTTPKLSGVTHSKLTEAVTPLIDIKSCTAAANAKADQVLLQFVQTIAEWLRSCYKQVQLITATPASPAKGSAPWLANPQKARFHRALTVLVDVETTAAVTVLQHSLDLAQALQLKNSAAVITERLKVVKAAGSGLTKLLEQGASGPAAGHGGTGTRSPAVRPPVAPDAPAKPDPRRTTALLNQLSQAIKDLPPVEADFHEYFDALRKVKKLGDVPIAAPAAAGASDKYVRLQQLITRMPAGRRERQSLEVEMQSLVGLVVGQLTKACRSIGFLVPAQSSVESDDETGHVPSPSKQGDLTKLLAKELIKLAEATVKILHATSAMAIQLDIASVSTRIERAVPNLNGLVRIALEHLKRAAEECDRLRDEKGKQKVEPGEAPAEASPVQRPTIQQPAPTSQRRPPLKRSPRTREMRERTKAIQKAAKEATLTGRDLADLKAVTDTNALLPLQDNEKDMQYFLVPSKQYRHILILGWNAFEDWRVATGTKSINGIHRGSVVIFNAGHANPRSRKRTSFRHYTGELRFYSIRDDAGAALDDALRHVNVGGRVVTRTKDGYSGTTRAATPVAQRGQRADTPSNAPGYKGFRDGILADNHRERKAREQERWQEIEGILGGVEEELEKK